MHGVLGHLHVDLAMNIDHKVRHLYDTESLGTRQHISQRGMGCRASVMALYLSVSLPYKPPRHTLVTDATRLMVVECGLQIPLNNSYTATHVRHTLGFGALVTPDTTAKRPRSDTQASRTPPDGHLCKCPARPQELPRPCVLNSPRFEEVGRLGKKTCQSSLLL